MSVLPQGIAKETISYEYFPTVWQAVVWRNWGYVPVSRIAKALKTTEECIRQAAGQLGLSEELNADVVWKKRGYLTLIRNNWHLCTYEQILILLDISEEMLAFILKEDDFMWVKMGELKPVVEAPAYFPLTQEELEKTKQIADLFRKRFFVGCNQADNGFEFVENYQKPVTNDEMPVIHVSDNLRMVYPYFALYGDALIDDSIDPLPEGLLKEYAKVGINGIWIQLVLYQMVEFPFEPSLSEGWKTRIMNLNKLVAKAKKYGIGIYPYFNEPRAMSDKFFEQHPHLRGSCDNDYYALCTSQPEVQQYLYRGMKQLFELVPDLAGYVTITMSENLTNCYSRAFTFERGPQEIECPRCKARDPWEVVAEVNNLMAKGAHDANPQAKAIVWTWGWYEEWVDKGVDLLNEDQIVQCTSETGLEYCIGGVKGEVIDYTMSLCGPGEQAKRVWKMARDNGLQTSAKVQMNVTWEMAAVPFIPVFDKIAQHIQQFRQEGVEHVHASWTLGGCPSPNLSLVAWMMEDKGTVAEFLEDWLGEESGHVVDRAQQKLSRAFSEFPFHINSLYYGPQNFGPMAPFFLHQTGYQATMVGFPYDDASKWSGNYPLDVFEEQYRQLCHDWKVGTEMLLPYRGKHEKLDELIVMAEAALYHFESAYHHVRFCNLRGAEILDKEKMIQVIHEEMKTVQNLIICRMEDSRIGYESSNHYFYTLQDLREKLINLAFCEKELMLKTEEI